MNPRPCPVCGRQPQFEMWDATPHIKLWSLVCKDGDHICWGDYRLTKDDAIVEWNMTVIRRNYKNNNEVSHERRYFNDC